MGDVGRVGIERDGSVAIVTLDRPERLNTLTQVMIEEFADASATLQADPDVRCIVLTGAGERAPSSGCGRMDAGLETSHVGTLGYPCNRRTAGQVVLHGRFAGGRSRLGGCPRVCGGVRGVFDGRLVAMRSW